MGFPSAWISQRPWPLWLYPTVAAALHEIAIDLRVLLDRAAEYRARQSKAAILLRELNSFLVVATAIEFIPALFQRILELIPLAEEAVVAVNRPYQSKWIDIS